MPSSPNPAHEIALRAEQAREQRRRLAPQLNATMTCDTAFRVIARNCLENLTANHAGTCTGDHASLHEMRIALTRLRAAIAFFSPMAVDAEWIRLKRELKWLNGRLGDVRDIDVAIERLEETGKRQHRAISNYRSWQQKCADRHQALARALRSDRYRRLFKSVSDWVEHGSWSRNKDRAKQRASGVARYSRWKLTLWHEKLLKKSRKLEHMSAQKRHRLRLANKRLRYSIEFLSSVLSNENAALQTTLKHLRKAQESLGELNDASQGRALAAQVERNGLNLGDFSRLFDNKREKKLMRVATRAYRKMAALKPL